MFFSGQSLSWAGGQIQLFFVLGSLLEAHRESGMVWRSVIEQECTSAHFTIAIVRQARGSVFRLGNENRRMLLGSAHPFIIIVKLEGFLLQASQLHRLGGSRASCSESAQCSFWRDSMHLTSLIYFSSGEMPCVQAFDAGIQSNPVM